MKSDLFKFPYRDLDVRPAVVDNVLYCQEIFRKKTLWDTQIKFIVLADHSNPTTPSRDSLFIFRLLDTDNPTKGD